MIQQTKEMDAGLDAMLAGQHSQFAFILAFADQQQPRLWHMRQGRDD